MTTAPSKASKTLEIIGAAGYHPERSGNEQSMSPSVLKEGRKMRLHMAVAGWLAACVPGIASAGVPSDVTLITEQIDDVARKQAAAAGITPAERTTDAEFLRRVWLDLAGRTPPVDAAMKVPQEPLVRAKLVEQLLQSPDYAHHWGRLWTEYLTDRRPFDQNEYDPRRLQQFLTAAVKENTPYHQLLGELLMGDGVSDCTGPVNFLLRYNAEPVALTGAVSQKFLGVSLQCAECHDHPHAAWKQADFWGLAAHFARLRKMQAANAQEGENFLVVVERPRGELTMPDRKAPKDENGNQPRKTIFPQLPGQPRSAPDQPRRGVLVAWLTGAENPYVSRHLVNIVWQRLMGDKLIENFDHWPPESPSSAEVQLLNLLADDFVQHDFDIQRVIQAIVLSETYQRSARPAKRTEETAAAGSDEIIAWSRAKVRPLSADQLHLSLGQAFGYHHDENDFRLAEATGEEFTYDLPTASFHAAALSVGRSVALYNSEHIRGAVDFGAESLVRLYGPSAGPEHIERLFLALLTRRPTAQELEMFQDLAGVNDVRQGLQDATWVILNSTEFVTNH